MIKTKLNLYKILILQFLFFSIVSSPAYGWFGKTHIAIAKTAGYKNWYNAAAADLAKLKAGNIEQYNHFVNNKRGDIITPKMILEQVKKYNDPYDGNGHLYGAIVATVRLYIKDKKEGIYPQDHMAYCVHYVGDLSMPLHNIEFNEFNKNNHMKLDGIVEHEIMNNLSRIKIEKKTIKTEDDLVREIARIANISTELGFKLEKENRMMTKDEAYRQLGYSASLLKGILEYVDSK